MGIIVFTYYLRPDDGVSNSLAYRLSSLETSFPAGCNTIMDAVTAKGQTPASNSPSDIATAISNISTNSNIKYIFNLSHIDTYGEVITSMRFRSVNYVNDTFYQWRADGLTVRGFYYTLKPSTYTGTTGSWEADPLLNQSIAVSGTFFKAMSKMGLDSYFKVYGYDLRSSPEGCVKFYIKTTKAITGLFVCPTDYLSPPQSYFRFSIPANRYLYQNNFILSYSNTECNYNVNGFTASTIILL